MESAEIPATDSGYPTPREDLPSSSRSESPPCSPDFVPMTSTPLRGTQYQRMRDPLGPRSNSLSDELSTIVETDTSGLVIRTPQVSFYQLYFPSENVKSLLSLAKEVKAKRRQNAALHDENDTLRDQNESLRDENLTLREESRRMEIANASLRQDHGEDQSPPIIPKLNLNEVNQEHVVLGNLKITDDIKKELLSFIKNEEDRTVLEGKLEHMLNADSKPPPSKVFTATATVQVDTERMDADAQTERDDHVNVVNANLKIEVDQLHSQLEVTEKKNFDLKNRLFDYEKLKAKFEESEEKLRSDLEKKLKATQEKIDRYENKIEELELRLNKKRKDHDEVQAENQRLVEDRNTHEFEVDELKVHSDEMENKWKRSEERVEQLEKEIRELEAVLEEEKQAKIEMESEFEKARNKLKKVIEEVRREADEADNEKNEALEQLNKMRIENKRIVKDNEYLTAAQQALLDSEIQLKNEQNVMAATFRNTEQKLLFVEEQLAEEKRYRLTAEAEIEDLSSAKQQLENEKRDVDELLDELRKGKLEIDYLRQKIQFASQETDEMRQLRDEFDDSQRRARELDEKLKSAQKKEDELTQKHEEHIRKNAEKDVELVRLRQEVYEQNEKIIKLTGGANESRQIIEELQRALESLELEYEDFKTHANMQYIDQIGQRDEQIALLHKRLVELETYPGQTISVSKRSAESQTDEPETAVVEEEQSPEVTLVSEDPHPLERNIKLLIDKMEEYIQGRSIAGLAPSFQSEPGAAYHCAETFRQIVEVLRDLLAFPEAPIEKTQDFWSALNERMELQETVFQEKLNTAKKLAFDEVRRIEADCKKTTDAAEDKMYEMEKIAQQRLYLANEFREQYDIEVKEKDELAKMREEELKEWEKSNKDLRERLEQIQHLEQLNARARLERSDKHEEAVDELQNAFNKIERDLKFRLSMTEEELSVEKKRREYDRASMTSIKNDFYIVVERCEYLKERNSARQKMLNDLKLVLLKCMQSDDGEKTIHLITKMKDRLDRSGLLDDTEVPGRSQTVKKRRVLSNVNNCE